MSAYTLLGLCQESPPISKTNRTFKNGIELRHDNDFLLFTDRYYTTGTFVGIRVKQESTDSVNQKQYRLFIQQEIYTPADLLEDDIELLDRPYAGFFGISNGLQLTNNKRLLDINLLLGFSGPFSAAEKLQSAFHDTAAEDSRVATWEGQLKNSLHTNLYVEYAREWKLEPNPFSVHFALNPISAIGTRDIYLQQNVVAYFGRRNPMNSSAAYHQVGIHNKEWFFAIRAGYRYIFHDALLEGNAIKDNSIFVKEPYQNLFIYNFEMYHRNKRNSYKLSYNFNTPRTQNTDPHIYMLFSFLRSF
ncbi:MAG: lipid A deacylase LpxR family protein [Bacteroidetes bacterium]|nr:lipid A deacylase LpxR family protein [Bacteroidota bacterium]